uniref:Uncharacterized protein n=1 Tax=Rhizophora mucronata TaxID=61149 RepID=A0A2P2K4A9_RHIMU
MFNIREYARHTCKRPTVFFMESVISGENSVLSNYTRHNADNCSRANAIKNLKHVEVFSHKLEPDAEQVSFIGLEKSSWIQKLDTLCFCLKNPFSLFYFR